MLFNKDSSEFDQIYYRTLGIEGICKLYDLEEPASMERFNNEMYLQVDIGSNTRESA